MKSILLIGLGRFGKHVAVHLHNLGHQVMAVDSTEERVNAVLHYVAEAQIGDSTNESILSSWESAILMPASSRSAIISRVPLKRPLS